MSKKLLRISKRILIYILCTSLISGTIFYKNKMEVKATSVAVGLGAYSLYEICLYAGTILISTLGLGYAYENRDDIASLGKQFIDSMDLSEVNDWMFTKVDTTGSSYVYGTEALELVQSTSFTVIQGGGNRPDDDDDDKNDDDNNESGSSTLDVQSLANIAVAGTTAFTNLCKSYIEPLIEDIQNGEENFITKALGIETKLFTEDELAMINDWAIYNDLYFDGHLEPDSSGIYNYKCFYYYELSGVGYRLFYNLNTSEKIAGYYSLGNGINFNKGLNMSGYQSALPSGNWYLKTSKVSDGAVDFGFPAIYRCNFPIFNTKAEMDNYLETGNLDNCINNTSAKYYQIADWLQEDWHGVLEYANNGVRSLADNVSLAQTAANQALLNQLTGQGYIEDFITRIGSVLPMTLPSTIADPIYYPADFTVPHLDPSEYPWTNTNPGVVPNPNPNPNPEPLPDSPDDSGNSESDFDKEIELKGTDPFGLDTIFGILILLIMIIIMLLFVFLSCLAFIIMIFRIPAQTGFLPDEMIAGLDYLKTLQIPGFNMSVYGFFMALVYIILIFTVIGILRKNIDKIRFPRKGRH